MKTMPGCPADLTDSRLSCLLGLRRTRAEIMVDNLDDALMNFVNLLSVFIMVSVAGYHYVTVNPRDLEA